MESIGIRYVFGLALLLLLSGCATLPKGVYQRGVASWYGKGFQGKKTASGEVFDMHKLTAAHPSLPFGTILRVKSLSTGKHVEVRVNDRGPYAGGRIIDLSYSAAEKLGFLSKGEDRVEISVMRSPSSG